MSYKFENTVELMKEGDYEAKIERMEIKILPTSGKEKLSVMFRIRSDIDGQAYGNKCLFDDIWKEKESPEHFNRKRLNMLIGTQDIKDGTVFETINDIINMLIGCCVRIHVTKVFDDYHGEEVNKIAYYMKSKAQPKTLDNNEGKKPKASSPASPDVVDDDLPF